MISSLKSYMKPGDQFTIQRLGHRQLARDGIDNEDSSGRLVSSWPSYTVPQREVFISIGPDLRIQMTIILNRRENEPFQRHSRCHARYRPAPSHPGKPWDPLSPVPHPHFLVTGFKKRCHLSTTKTGGNVNVSKNTHRELHKASELRSISF